jgi:hypothetical protein
MESVMDMARTALGSDALARISAWLGESPSVTKAAVRDAIPMSVLGLASQASTDEGSRALLGHLQNGDYPHIEPEELSRAVSDPDATDRLAQSSQGFMGGLFGGQLGSVVEGIARHTGASRDGISNLLGLAAPLVTGLIGKRTMARNLDASGLRRYLGEQGNLAAGQLPGSLAKLVMPAGPAAVAVVPGERRRGFPWWVAGLVALLALVAFGLSRL